MKALIYSFVFLTSTTVFASEKTVDCQVYQENNVIKNFKLSVTNGDSPSLRNHIGKVIVGVDYNDDVDSLNVSVIHSDITFESVGEGKNGVTVAFSIKDQAFEVDCQVK